MAGTYRALLIGNSSFPADPHNLQPLAGPVNDVASLRAALAHELAGLFDPGEVRLVVERGVQEIRTELERFFTSARRDDTLLLYYSGHGVLDQRNQLFLCANDTRSDLLRSTAVGAAEISQLFDDSAAGTTVILLDCCHSGAFKGGTIHESLRGSGRYLLTSARSRELAADATTQNGTSLFTQKVVEGLLLGASDTDRDGFADLEDLYDYVYETLVAEGGQIPQRSFAGGGAVPIARRTADRGQPVPTVRPVEPGGPPLLRLSSTRVDLGDLEPAEVSVTDPPKVEVFVVNEGGGSLDWVATTDANWIEVEPHGTFVRLILFPRPGPNVGRVQVVDRAGGTTRLVEVSAHVSAKVLPPPIPPNSGPRWLAWLAAGAVAVALVAGGVRILGGAGDQSEPGRPSRADAVTVLVPGDQPWVDTGVKVGPGQRVAVAASGSIVHDAPTGRRAGPGGDPSRDVQQYNVVADMAHGGLLGRIGPEGEPFPVGSAWEFTGPLPGGLYLQVNDVGLDNNGGQFTVRVTVTST